MNQREKFDNLSDAELLELFQRHRDNEFLGAIYNRYTHLIYGVCLKYLKERETAKDAVMDIFESLAAKFPEQEIQDFGRWIHVVAKNHCLMKLRKRDILRNSEETTHIFMESGELTHHNNEVHLREDELRKLEAGVQDLPEEQMTCIQLFYFEEKSYAEISTETGFDIKSVKSYIQNGKRNLKNWLEKRIE